MVVPVSSRPIVVRPIVVRPIVVPATTRCQKDATYGRSLHFVYSVSEPDSGALAIARESGRAPHDGGARHHQIPGPGPTFLSAWAAPDFVVREETVPADRLEQTSPFTTGTRKR